MIWISNYDVVENFDFEKLTGSNEVAGDFYVGFRWSWIATRVRMRDNDCGSTCHYCQSENFPRMTKDCIHRANGHQVVTFYASAGVEDEYHQTFTFRIEIWMLGDVRSPIISGLGRRFAKLHGFGCGTFPQGNNFPFLRLRWEFNRFDDVVRRLRRWVDRFRRVHVFAFRI